MSENFLQIFEVANLGTTIAINVRRSTSKVRSRADNFFWGGESPLLTARGFLGFDWMLFLSACCTRQTSRL
jgi:hypothetical protein